MTEHQLPKTIEALLDPNIYPHPVKEPIQLIQTHASFVLLTGDYVYKIKKSVNFGFLDYSTLEKRRHFCQEEVRMNRRSAPEIYLGVVALTQTADTPVETLRDRLEFDGTGDPVEYAVKMRQFPQECLFSSLFQAGKLSEDRMRELGRVVAEFHGKTETDDRILQFGEIAQIRQAIDENYRQTEKYIGGPQTRQQFEETKAYSDRFFVERKDLFKTRIAREKIRECHGDLHLRNIALYDDRIILFDCIEFNESFRFVDVMYDIAFAVMDLESRGSHVLATVFLNEYLERTGDWEGVQVLPLYLSRQAYVRGKVTSFLLDDPTVDETEKDRARDTAAHYYELAWQYTRRDRGRLILMSGLSGSGKSTVARQLAKPTGAIHIRSDAVRKHLAGIALHDRGTDAIYTPEMSRKTYGRLLELGELLASQGFTVILDAKYDTRNHREAAIAVAEKREIPLTIAHCTAPMEVLRDRLHQRRGDIADATADLLASQQQAAESFTEREQAYVRTIDTTAAIAPQLEAFFAP
ncbi:bifunctional aminoglycoside phosphotransferase/ATP-binding protein [Oxynema aestuarii]|jgi:aminoglycoside phosphotransferase family enzyme/predicted kinase|uniref:gluconokinase n=1 Tax=Oxynema aestuarii AP17 TaxID=2064643 RepID=A0A6H1U2S5_9CYAN|nr:bifunctional aminoglycoside phosphotransferase/ATP-binding protein [Oxynema aestuarii]QIZ72955.1 AAA family ATPase [Oxynema aestuarii AP17]RMH75633.1 MAG: adenylyl-sulfate kinase [Cyanobacteria bacterium J007]